MKKQARLQGTSTVSVFYAYHQLFRVLQISLHCSAGAEPPRAKTTNRLLLARVH